MLVVAKGIRKKADYSITANHIPFQKKPKKWTPLQNLRKRFVINRAKRNPVAKAAPLPTPKVSLSSRMPPGTLASIRE